MTKPILGRLQSCLGRDSNAYTSTYMRLTDGKGQTVSAARRLGVVHQGAAIETLHRLHNTTTVMYYTIYTVGSLNI